MKQKIIYHVLKKWDFIVQRVFYILCGLLFICTLISSGNVILRKFFSFSSNALLELQWMFFSAVFLLGAAQLLKEDGHIRIDIFYNKFRPSLRRKLTLCLHIFLTLPSLLVVFYMSLPFWLNAFMPLSPDQSWFHYLFFDQSHFEYSPNAGGLATPFAKMVLPLGFLMLIGQVISEILKLFLCISDD
ncbi:MAG: TRAP transporter small permease subunit [Pseudomonadota bacterium]